MSGDHNMYCSANEPAPQDQTPDLMPTSGNEAQPDPVGADPLEAFMELDAAAHEAGLIGAAPDVKQMVERLRSWIPNGDGYNSDFANDMLSAVDLIERLSRERDEALWKWNSSYGAKQLSACQKERDELLEANRLLCEEAVEHHDRIAELNEQLAACQKDA